MPSLSGIAGTGDPGKAASAPDPRLKPAAHEFEACLMKEFLAPLEKDPLFGEDAGEGGERSGSALVTFGSEALAKAISERGGFGIATKILEHFGNGKDLPKGNTQAQIGHDWHQVPGRQADKRSEGVPR
ncbi:MAG: hypothetical protein ACLGXA_22200 [Acidobacteriota bacterium]